MIACSGERAAEGDLAKGAFMKPPLFVNVDNPYGLGGAVWTRDINRAIRVARGIEREIHKVMPEHYTDEEYHDQSGRESDWVLSEAVAFFKSL